MLTQIFFFGLSYKDDRLFERANDILGTSIGTLAGAGATYAAQSGSGIPTSFENVALGAGIVTQSLDIQVR